MPYQHTGERSASEVRAPGAVAEMRDVRRAAAPETMHNRPMDEDARPSIRWGAVRAVGLDLMDTLIYDPFREAIEKVSGMTLEELGRRRDVGVFHEFELGRISEEEFGERFFLPGEGDGLDVRRLWSELESGYRFLPGMEELAAELAERLPVLVLSNFSRWYERIRRRFDLDRFVAQHHASFEIGARKPAPLYFERVLARSGLEPHEIVFVDDRAANVEGARSAGLPALRFAGAFRLRTDLSGILERRPRSRPSGPRRPPP